MTAILQVVNLHDYLEARNQSWLEDGMNMRQAADLSSFKLIWLTEGALAIRLKEEQRLLAAPSLLLLFPGQLFAIEEKDVMNGQMLICCPAVAGDGPEFSLLKQLYGLDSLLRPDSAQTAVIHHLFALLGTVSDLTPAEVQARIGLCLQLIIAELLRIGKQAKTTESAKTEVPIVKQYMELLEREYASRMQVSDYALKLHVSVGHLSKLLRRIYGKSAGQLLREKQMAEAMRLLRTTVLPIEEVSSLLSYRDASYFGRMFKKLVGISPTTFRKECQG
jgi:AraC family transcriptional activator of pobA